MMAVFDHIYILVIIYLFLSLLLRFNIMNHIQKKIFLYQTLFFISICSSLCYFNIEINNFITSIIGLIIVFLNAIIYSEVLEN